MQFLAHVIGLESNSFLNISVVMKKLFSIVAIALMTVTAAFAQENNNRDEYGNVVRGPYLTNSFGDNWFINLGAGVNSVLSSPDVKFGIGGLAIDANIGKWFTPTVGARIGYRGIGDSFTVNSGYKTLIDNGSGKWDASRWTPPPKGRPWGRRFFRAPLFLGCGPFGHCLCRPVSKP